MNEEEIRIPKRRRTKVEISVVEHLKEKLENLRIAVGEVIRYETGKNRQRIAELEAILSKEKNRQARVILKNSIEALKKRDSKERIMQLLFEAYSASS